MSFTNKIIGNILGNKPKKDFKSRNNEIVIPSGSYKVANGALTKTNERIDDKAMILKTEKAQRIMSSLPELEGALIISYPTSPYEVYKKVNR